MFRNRLKRFLRMILVAIGTSSLVLILFLLVEPLIPIIDISETRAFTYIAFVVFSIGVVFIISFLSWNNQNHEYEDLANIVLLVNDASAMIGQLTRKDEIYKAINEIFTNSATFDSVILELSDDRSGLAIEVVSMSPMLIQGVNSFFIANDKGPLFDYQVSFENVGIFNEIINDRSNVIFKRSELFSQLFGGMVGGLITLIGESENVGLPIYKNGDVIGMILITAPAMAKEFVPAANNLTDIISRQLDRIEADEKIVLMNNDLIRKNRELVIATERSQKLAIDAQNANQTKSTFLANMSHEIRTPLNAIIGFVDSVLQDEISGDHKEQLTHVKNGSNFLKLLINDILDISKIEANEIEIKDVSFSLSELLETLNADCESLRSYQNKNIEISFQHDIPQNEYLKMDRFRLQQVLMNLLGNAIKFTDSGSVLCSVVIVDDRISFNVADSGIGIPESKAELIFEPFKQADTSTTREYGGTGLGLSISSRLVKLMGGVLTVDTKPEDGFSTVFTCDLPYIKAGVPSNTIDLQITTSNGEGKLVLVVDDNHINRLIAKRLLEKMNYVVSLAANGQDAVEMHNKNNFDLILMDLQMPVLDGYGAVKKIREYENENDKYTPIIAMTANTFLEDRKRCNDAGMDGFIEKPITCDILSQTISSHFIK